MGVFFGKPPPKRQNVYRKKKIPDKNRKANGG